MAITCKRSPATRQSKREVRDRFRAALLGVLLCAITVLCTEVARAEGPYLVKDINDVTAPYLDSEPGPFTSIGDVVFFAATTPAAGRELWKSDGTAEGTSLVKDIRPGIESSEPSELVVLGDTLYFVATDDEHGGELWASDGTPDGTVLVKDIRLGTSSSITGLVAIDNVLYFAANDGAHGIELWKSDGTEAGTVMVEDIVPGDRGSSPTDLTVMGGQLFFVSESRELWKSDGSAAGTEFIIDDYWFGLVASPDTLFFVMGPSYFYQEGLWKSDGTVEGTEFVVDVGHIPKNLVVAGDRVYFSTLGTEKTLPLPGERMWASDGTAAGTFTIVGPLEASSAGPRFAPLGHIGGTLYFSFYEFGGSMRVWATAGTPAETTLVLLLDPIPDQALLAGTTLYYIFVSQIWKSDTLGSDLVLVKDINPGGNAQISDLFVAGDKVYFAANDGVHGQEPWSTDGTANGTALVKNISTSASSSSPREIVSADDVIYFKASDPIYGYELWRSDGTESGTTVVADINPNIGGSTSDLGELIIVGTNLFFAADTNSCCVAGGELWISDGTEAGTTQVKDINPGEPGSSPDDLAELSGTLFFQAYDGVHGDDLWKSDGTEEGTERVKDIEPGSGALGPEDLTAVSGMIYFIARAAELWKSDGTGIGTVLVKDISAGVTSGRWPTNLTAVGDTLYFTKDDDVYGEELWKSDGTDASTVLVKDIRPGVNGSDVNNLMNVGGILFFSADDGVTGNELWKSDGTSIGTTSVADINPGIFHSYPTKVVAAGNYVFFFADDGIHGREL